MLKPIHLAFVLALFNMFSVGGARVLVTLYALKLGAQPLTIGLLAAAFAVFPMLLAWQAGKVLDRLGPRLPLTLGAAAGAGGLLLPYFVPTVPALFIAATVSGLSMTYYNVSLQNLVGTLSNPNTRARNYSNYSMAISAGFAGGPLVAGIAIDRLGHLITFPLVAGLMIVPLILLAVWGGTLPGGRRDAGPAHSIRDTLTNPQLWPVLAMSGIAQCGLELFQVYVPVYGVAQGLSASAIGVIIGTSAAGGFAGRLLLTRLIAWCNEEKVLAYALMVGALSFTAVPFFTSAAALSIVAFVFGFGLNCSQPITLMLIYSRSAQGQSGAALGLRFAVDNGVRLVSPVLLGMVASAFGLGVMFWLNALVLGAGGVLTHVDAGKRKHQS